MPYTSVMRPSFQPLLRYVRSLWAWVCAVVSKPPPASPDPSPPAPPFVDRRGPPKPYQEIQLTDFWINTLLRGTNDAVYEISRAEPFRLKAVRASALPVTPVLMERTIRTVVGIMEPGQKKLVEDFCQALRAVTPDTPQQLLYQSSRYGETRCATIVDLVPSGDRLFVHCSSFRA